MQVQDLSKHLSGDLDKNLEFCGEALVLNANAVLEYFPTLDAVLKPISEMDNMENIVLNKEQKAIISQGIKLYSDYIGCLSFVKKIEEGNEAVCELFSDAMQKLAVLEMLLK